MKKNNKIKLLKKVISLYVNQNKFNKAEYYLLDYNFIHKKTTFIGVPKLIEDYKLVLKYGITDKEKKEALETLLSSLEQVSHILKDYPQQINSQLIGYLEKGSNHFINEIIKTIDKTKGTWLKPIKPNLSSQQGSLVKIYKGNEGNISALNVFDNKYIISGSSIGEVKIWDINSSKEKVSFQDKDGWISDIKILKKNYIIYFSCNDKDLILKIWDTKSEKIISKVQGISNETKKLKLTQDEKYIITKDSSKKLIVWQVPSLKKVQIIKSKYAILNFEIQTFSNKYRLITSSYIGDVDFKTKIKVFTFLWRKFRCTKKFFIYGISNINNFIIDKNNNTVFISGLGGEIKVFSLKDKKCKFDIKVINESSNFIDKIFLTGNEKEVLVISSHKSSLWNLEHGKLIKNIEEDRNGYENGIIKNRMFAFSGFKDDIINIWDLKNIAIINQIRTSFASVKSIKKINNYIISYQDKDIKQWNLYENISKNKNNHIQKINSIRAFDKGKMAVTISSDKSIKIFNLENFSCEHTFTKNKGSVDVIDVFKKGDDFFAISSDIDSNHILKVWNISQKKNHSTLSGHHLGEIMKIEIIRNGTQVISISFDFTVKLWDLINEECVYTFYITNHDKENSYGFGMTFEIYNHEKNLITGTSNGTLRVWNLQNGKLIKNLIGHNGSINSISVSANGKSAITSSNKGKIILWNLQSYKGEIIKIDKNGSYNIEFLPYRLNLRLLYTEEIICSNKNNQETHFIYSLNKGIIKLCDLSSKNCIKKFIGHSDKINNIFILKKSVRIISTTYSGEIILWDIFTGKIITSLFIGRTITSATITPNEKVLIIGEFNGQLHFIRIKNDLSSNLKIVR